MSFAPIFASFLIAGLFMTRFLPSLADQSPQSRHPPTTILPLNESRRFIGDASPGQLLLLFTGDPQYHYPCTAQNRECKERSRECHDRHLQALRREKSGGVSTPTAASRELGWAAGERHFDECTRIESAHANEVQRKSIFDVNRRLAVKPKALVINGDLTNYGHVEQLNLFKSEWLTLPVPILAGLGNHDYENNVNDCVANQCANNMLYWFTNLYAPARNLSLDYRKSALYWKTKYEGSLAYSTDICDDGAASDDQNNHCVHLIQLHNRPDYAASISSASEWTITGSFEWLSKDLAGVGNASWPVLINLHNHNSGVARRLKGVIEQWMNRTRVSGAKPRVMVLYAHIHENHAMQEKCVGGVRVPHLYVGSVPNNRYTAIRFYRAAEPANGTGGDRAGSRAEIFLLQANANGTTSVLERIKWEWTRC